MRTTSIVSWPGRGAALLVVAGAALLLAGPAVAGPAPERDHLVTLDDYFTLAYVSQVAASPDGGAALYVVGRWRRSSTAATPTSGSCGRAR